jgi:hypothetical protein
MRPRFSTDLEEKSKAPMTHEQEHLCDCWIDTWQAAEAEQFIRDEAAAEISLREAEEKD